MESFEITFFCDKNKDDISDIRDFSDSYNKYVGLNNYVEFEKFDDEKDYYEIRCSIFGLVLNESIFAEFIESVTNYVDYIFERFSSVEVVTGIYELTYYYTENLKGLLEFLPKFLQNFPLVFLRNQKNASSDVLYKNDRIICLYHRNAQMLFPY